jgi:nucleolar protein 53
MKVTDQEYVETKAGHVETQEVAEKKDEELFVIDTTAVLPSQKQSDKKEKKEKDPRRNPSLKEQAQIEKLVQQHSSSELKQLVKRGNASARSATRKGSVQPNFDLWGEEPKSSSSDKKKRKINDHVIGSAFCGTKPAEHVKIVSRPAMQAPTAKAKLVTVDVAKDGQSYNPDKLSHRKVLHEAVQVEQKRQFAEKEAKAPVSSGMTAETKAFLVGSDSEDSDDDEATNKEDGETADGPAEKILKKLTRAQRNKQKRVREEQREIDSRKRQKKLQNSVAEAKTITKQLKRNVIAQNERREELEKIKLATERTKGANVYERLSNVNPIHAPTYPVALRSELKQTGGSLRTITPKGSLITDRMVSLADRDMTAKKQLKKRTRVEGKRRKMRIKVRGKGFAESKEAGILG